MILSKEQVEKNNKGNSSIHKKKYEFISGEIDNAEEVLRKLTAFQIAIPSWALGTGGTRFGRFGGGGEPRLAVITHRSQYCQHGRAWVEHRLCAPHREPLSGWPRGGIVAA